MKKIMLLCAAMLALNMNARGQDTLYFDDVCWPTFSDLPGFYSLSEDGHKLAPGGAYDVVPMEASANVELVGNDSVRVSGEVADRKTHELIPFFVVYAVDTNAAKEYIIKSTVASGDEDGDYTFTVPRNDGQMFIIHAVGYAELFLQLHCCIGCTQKNSTSTYIEFPKKK